MRCRTTRCGFWRWCTPRECGHQVGHSAKLTTSGHNSARRFGEGFLHATVQQQAERTAMDTQRPLLQTKDRAGKLNELMTMREPLYRAAADLIIETAGKSPKVVVELIRQHLD